MFLPNKAAIETEIVNRYLNSEINLLEKEVALNVILSFTKPETDLDEREIMLFQQLALVSVKTLVDYMVDYGRSHYNSDKLKSDELIELTKAALRKREQLEREQVNE
jgi:hypothetical protein